MASIAMLQGVRGVILDAVGTLIDPCPSVGVAYAEAALRQGVVIDRAEVRKRFAEHFAADECDEIRGPLSTSEAIELRRWSRIVRDCLPELPDPELGFRELWDHFADPRSWRLVSDAEGAVAELRGAGFEVCVASNFDGRLRGVLRGLLGVTGWSDDPVISSEVGFRKPHPDFYRAACQRLRLPPDQVISVGDDRENDVEGAIRAGLRAVRIDRESKTIPDTASLASLASLAKLLLSAQSAQFEERDWRDYPSMAEV